MEFFDVCSCRSLEIPFDLACCSLDTEAATHFPALPDMISSENSHPRKTSMFFNYEYPKAI